MPSFVKTALLSLFFLASGAVMALEPKNLYDAEDFKAILVETGHLDRDGDIKVFETTPSTISFAYLDLDGRDREIVASRKTLLGLDADNREPAIWYDKVPFRVTNLKDLRLAACIHMALHAKDLASGGKTLYDGGSISYDDLLALVERGEMSWKNGAFRYETSPSDAGVSFKFFPEAGAVVTLRNHKIIYRHLISQFWWFSDGEDVR